MWRTHPRKSPLRVGCELLVQQRFGIDPLTGEFSHQSSKFSHQLTRAVGLIPIFVAVIAVSPLAYAIRAHRLRRPVHREKLRGAERMPHLP